MQPEPVEELRRAACVFLAGLGVLSVVAALVAVVLR